jgi:hypothetical protein
LPGERGWIDNLATIACSKHGIGSDEAVDFDAWCGMKLVEDD